MARIVEPGRATSFHTGESVNLRNSGAATEPTRRALLKGLASTTALVPFSGVTLSMMARPARAEAATAAAVVMVIVAIVSAVGALFARPDGTRKILAAINIKLDHIITAQQATLDAVQLISEQVDDLARAIPNYIVNADLRGRRVELESILDRQQSTLVEIEAEQAGPEQEDNLNRLALEAWKACTEFYRMVNATTTGNDQDHEHINQCMRAIALQRDLVIGFLAADQALGKVEARAALHGQKYRDMADAVLATASVYRRNHLKWSKEYHARQAAAAEKSLSAKPYKAWLARLKAVTAQSSKKSSTRLSKDDSFLTLRTFGTCPGGANTDDINEAIGFIQMIDGSKINWWSYKSAVPVKLRGRNTYHKGQHVGYANFSARLGTYSSRFLAEGPIRTLTRARAYERRGFPLPMRVKEYNCPGFEGHDAGAWSQNHTQTAAADLARTVPKFVNLISELAFHSWMVIATDEATAELGDVIDNAKQVEEVTRS